MMASLADAQQNKNRLAYEEGLHIQRLSVLYMKPLFFFYRRRARIRAEYLHGRGEGAMDVMAARRCRDGQGR